MDSEWTNYLEPEPTEENYGGDTLWPSDYTSPSSVGRRKKRKAKRKAARVARRKNR